MAENYAAIAAVALEALRLATNIFQVIKDGKEVTPEQIEAVRSRVQSANDLWEQG